MATPNRRFVEALHDFETGVTFVRHPDNENTWVEVAIFDEVLKGCPTASVSGEEDCEIVSRKSVGIHSSIPVASEKLRLHVTVAGHHGPFSR